MKLLYFTQDGGHRNNSNAIQRMCSVSNIEYEETRDINRVYRDDYNILIAIQGFVDPSMLPAHIKIIYGPQFWVFPSGPVVGPLRDELTGRAAFNCLSPWVKEFWLETVDSFVCPIEPFPYAVDVNRFVPQPSIEKIYDCLIYVKDRHADIVFNIVNILNLLNISCRIIKYGAYKEDEYIQALHQSKFMIVLDSTESQGFALQEAMSCGVPLLVFDVVSMKESFNNGRFDFTEYPHLKMLGTSVPYWSDQCGIRTCETERAEEYIKCMLQNYDKYNPREYIVNNLSEKPCMNRILSYFGYPLV